MKPFKLSNDNLMNNCDIGSLEQSNRLSLNPDDKRTVKQVVTQS